MRWPVGLVLLHPLPVAADNPGATGWRCRQLPANDPATRREWNGDDFVRRAAVVPTWRSDESP